MDAFVRDGDSIPFYGTVTFPPAIYVAETHTTWAVWESFSTSGSRGVRIRGYDHGTGQWGPPYSIGTHPLSNDDHGVPAIVRDHDGYLHAFFGGHNSDVFEYVSDSPDDASSWTLRHTFEGDYTYPHPVAVGSALFLIIRKEVSGETRMPAVLFQTTALEGGVPTWSSEAEIIDFDTDSRAYVGTVLASGTDIHISATRSNWTDTYRRDVYHFVLDTTTGSISNSDASTTVTAANLPVGRTDADEEFRVYEHTDPAVASIPTIVFSGGVLHLAFADGSTTPAAVKHMTMDSGAWSSAEETNAGVPIEAGRAPQLSLAAMESGAVALYYPEDDADDWTFGGNIRRVVRTAGVWGSAQMVRAAGSRPYAVPAAVLGGHDDALIMFCERGGSSLDSEGDDFAAFMYGVDGVLTDDPGLVLTRTVDGLLYAGTPIGNPSHSVSFDSGDWTAGAGNAVSTPGGFLEITRTGSDSDNLGYVQLDAVDVRSKASIFARIRRTSEAARFGTAAHVSDVAPASATGHAVRLVGGLSSTVGIVQHVSGAGAFLDSIANQNAGTGPYNFWHYVDADEIIGWDSFTDNDWSAVGALEQGRPGLWRSGSTGGSDVRADAFFVSTDRYVTVGGLDDGDSVEIRAWDGTVLASGTASDGTATVDLPKISPTDTHSIFVLRSDQVITVYERTPAEFIVGGSTYLLGSESSSEPDSSSEPEPEPAARFLVQTECSSCLLAIGVYPTLTVRFQIARADDPSFAAPVYDSGFSAGDGTDDDGNVYTIVENLAPGHYLARIHAQTILEPDAISPDMPFTILDLSSLFLGGWRSGV